MRILFVISIIFFSLRTFASNEQVACLVLFEDKSIHWISTSEVEERIKSWSQFIKACVNKEVPSFVSNVPSRQLYILLDQLDIITSKRLQELSQKDQAEVFYISSVVNLKLGDNKLETLNKAKVFLKITLGLAFNNEENYVIDRVSKSLTNLKQAAFIAGSDGHPKYAKRYFVSINKLRSDPLSDVYSEKIGLNISVELEVAKELLRKNSHREKVKKIAKNLKIKL